MPQSKEAITLGRLLLTMHKISLDEAQILKDKFKVMGLDPEMLSVVPEEGGWRGHSPCSGFCHLLHKGSLQNKWWTISLLFSFLVIVKILFGFLPVQFLMQVFHKVKWYRENLCKAGDTWNRGGGTPAM